MEGMTNKFYFIVKSLIVIILIAGLSSEQKTTDREGLAEITGDAITKLLIISRENASCTIILEEGWNLVSFHCLDDLTVDPEKYLKEINASTVSIHMYDPYEPIDKWKAYNPNLPSWVVNDLTIMGREYGYWIRLSEPVVLEKNGTMFKPTSMDIKKGWNLRGYPTNYERNVTQSLAVNLGNDWSIVYTYNASDIADPWKMAMRYPPGNVTLDLQNFSPNYGYWINSTKTGEWYVNY